MNLRIKINMDNAAFETVDNSGNEVSTNRFANGDEPARILRRLADQMANGNLERGDSWTLRDFNGNAVGEAKVTR